MAAKRRIHRIVQDGELYKKVGLVLMYWCVFPDETHLHYMYGVYGVYGVFGCWKHDAYRLVAPVFCVLVLVNLIEQILA